MSDVITLDQAIDLGHATLQHIQTKKPPYTFLYTNYGLFNTFWKGARKVQGGKWLEGHIILGDEGNAAHKGIWNEDTHNIVNISKKFTIPWVHSTTNFSYNLIEMDLNQGPEQIYDVMDMKYDNMCREWTDDVFSKILLTPSSSDDVLTPHGIHAWLPLGTDNSTGGWTGYTPKYGDGNTYYVGGITCSSTVNSRFASYYADHNGQLDDSLLILLARAMLKLNFVGPTTPKPLDLNDSAYSPKFSLYTSENVITTLMQLYAKSDDQMGSRVSMYYNTPYFKNMPFEYVPLYDTADTYRYGTDPIVGINHDMLYPVVHSNWNFKIGKPVSRAPAGQHNVMTVYGDLQYAIFGNNRKHMGFLISQQ